MKPIKLAVVGLCLPLLACYEEPVRDHLHIAFAPGPAIVVTAARDIAAPSSGRDNPALEERLDEARSDLGGGWDRWSQGFADLGAVAERSTIERRDGTVRRGIHSALLDSFRPVERLLGNEGLSTYYNSTGEVRELQLDPAGSGQATRQQRTTIDETLVGWSEDVAAYLEAVTSLYAYLDRAPDRAAVCFGYIFDEDEDSLEPLSTGEGRLVAPVIETMERVADVLLIDSDQAYSLNELSRLVFDTFQGRLTIAPDGPIIEIEGFTESEGFIERPPVSLWASLETMVGLWLAPDLVTALVTPGPVGLQPSPDPVIFANRPRRWTTAPDPSRVESELRSRLQPETIYRVRWQTRPAPEAEVEIYELGLQQLATAEQDLPE